MCCSFDFHYTMRSIRSLYLYHKPDDDKSFCHPEMTRWTDYGSRYIRGEKQLTRQTAKGSFTFFYPSPRVLPDEIECSLPNYCTWDEAKWISHGPNMMYRNLLCPCDNHKQMETYIRNICQPAGCLGCVYMIVPSMYWVCPLGF